MDQGRRTYRRSVHEGTLTLAFVDGSVTGSDPQSGIPGEVLQRAFYTSAPFRRRG